MIDSARLGGECGERAGRPVEVVVEPDAGREGEQFGGDPCSQSVEAASAVALKPEAVFERPEDRFDALADPRQHGSLTRLVLARRTQHRGAVALARGLRKVTAGVALVAD